MSNKRVYTVSEVGVKPSLLHKNVPFQVTLDGKVVAEVVKPGASWRVCEICGESTQNIIQFQNEKKLWKTLILCDKCADEHL